MADNFQKITAKTSEFDERTKRMDADRDLHLMKPYTLLNSLGVEVKNAISITMNEARIFSDKVSSLVNAATMQSYIKGKGLSDGETTKVENFLGDLFISIDEILMRKGRKPLKPFIFFQDSLRGTIGTRNLLKEMPGGTYIPEVLQCDSRFLVYEFGAEKLLWAAPKFFRTKAMIESEYPEAKNIPTGKAIPVHEYADNEVLETYVNGKKIAEKVNTLGYPPYVIVESASGIMMDDADHEKYHAESIFAPVRGLFSEINRLASILVTLTQWSFLGPQQYESEAGELAQKPEKSPYGEQTVIPVEKGGGYRPFPISDIKNATRLLQSLLLSAIQRATFSFLEYGTLSMPLSAVAIQKMLNTREGVVAVRFFDTISYYQQTAKMFIDQYVNGGIKAVVGEPGIEREYDPKDLDKKYNIHYEFYPTSPEGDIANTAVAQQQKALGLPMRYIIQNTLKAQDPDGLMAMMADEKISTTDMAVMLFDQCFRLRDIGDKFKDRMEQEKYYWKAEFVLQQLETILRQRATNQLTGYNFEAGKSGGESNKPMVPLMAGGGAGGQSAGDEFAIPPEELEERAENRAQTVRRQSAEGE